MYWAANDAKVLSGQTASVGDNCATLASYASGLADSAIGNTCGQFSGRRRLRSHQDLSLPSRRRLTTYGPCEGCLVGSEGNLCKNPTNNVCYNYVNGVEEAVGVEHFHARPVEMSTLMLEVVVPILEVVMMVTAMMSRVQQSLNLQRIRSLILQRIPANPVTVLH